MKYLNKFSVINIVIAIGIGTLFAASLTDITYPSSAPNGGGERTPYIEGVVHYDGFVYRDGVVSSEGRSIASRGGSSYEDVFSHPGDLINNVQNSQVRFFKTFAITSLVSFAVLSIFSLTRKEKSTSTSQLKD